MRCRRRLGRGFGGSGIAWRGRGGDFGIETNALASVTVSADPLGVDIAQWINPATLTAIEPLLKAAGINQLHYSGGVTADQYDWSTEQDISNCSEAEQTPAAFATQLA